MKRLIFYIFFFSPLLLLAQEPTFCNKMLDSAKTALAAKKYNSARAYCEAALMLCKPDSFSFMNKKIDEAIEKEKDNAKKNAAKYLFLEADKAFKNEDIRLSYRLCQAALQYDSANLNVLALKDTLPYYSANIYYNYNNFDTISGENNYLFFYKDRLDSTKSDTLDVLNLRNSQLNHLAIAPQISYQHQWSLFENRYFGHFSLFYENDSILNIIDLQKMEIIKKIKTNNTSISTSYNSEMGSSLLTYFQEDTLNVLDVIRDNIIAKVPNVVGYSPKFNPSGRYLFFEKTDSTLNLLSIHTNKVTFLSKVQSYQNIEFSSNNKYLYFTSKRKNRLSENVYEELEDTTKIFDLNNKSLLLSFPCSRKTFSPNYNYLIFEGSSFDEFYSLKEYREIAKTKNYRKKHPLNENQFDSTSHEIIRSINTYGCLFDLVNHRIIRNFSILKKYSFSPNGQYLVFFEYDKKLNVLDCKTNRIIKSITNISYYDYKFSPDSRYLVFHEKNNVAQLWDLEQNMLVLNLEFLRKTDIDFSFNSQYLLIRSDSLYNNCIIWNIQSLKSYSFDSVSSKYRFSPNSKYITYIGIDNSLYLVELGSMKKHEISSNIYVRDMYQSYYFSSNTHYLAFKKDEKTIVIYDLQKLEEVRVIKHIFNTSNSIDSGEGGGDAIVYTEYGEGFKFLSDDFFMTSSIKLDIKEKKTIPKTIVKIFYLPLGKDFFSFYVNEYYAPLSEKEKQFYGIQTD